MQVGDLVKMEGGTLRPPWYGETGIVISALPGVDYGISNHLWYKVALVPSGSKMVRADMLVVLSEGR